MRRLARNLALACLAALAAASGCDRLLDGEHAPPPLAVVRGMAQGGLGEPTEIPAHVSLAIAWLPAPRSERAVAGIPLDPLPPLGSTACVTLEPWEPAACDGTPVRGRSLCRWTVPAPLVRAVENDRQDLLHFEVPIYELPPAAARVDLSRQGGHGTFALGYVAAFDDEDGDGIFRYGTPETPPEPILARSVVSRHEHAPSLGPPSTSYLVAYLDGQLDPGGLAAPGAYPELIGLAQGFNVFRTEIWSDTFRRYLGLRRRALPIDAPTVLAVLSEPETSLGCSEGSTEYRWVDAIPPGYAPVSCSAERDAASWHRSAGVLGAEIRVGPCASVVEEYEADFSCASVPPPAWDCPTYGELTIRVATSSPPGTDPGPHGFALRGAAGEPWASGTFDPNEEFTFRLHAGEYEVALEEPAQGCTAASLALPATVVEGGSSEVAFDVHCGASGAAAPQSTAAAAAGPGPPR